jgi:RNA recognition motif-containing protein
MESSKMYVGNLKYAVTDEQLSKLFAEFGEVKSANVIRGKGFGFVKWEQLRKPPRPRKLERERI